MTEHSGESQPVLQRLTQPDWCNAPQPGNWHNACMRTPGHDGEHAVRKVYRLDEAWYWPDSFYPVKYGPADRFSDLWDLRADAYSGSSGGPDV